MNNATRWAMTTGVAALLMGCSSGEKRAESFQDPFFPPRGNVPASKTIWDRQHAAGVAEDGMLFPIHFDGNALNSLGEAKLKGMLAGRPQGTALPIYLNLNKDDAANAARQTSLEQALVGLGVPRDQYTVAIGPNPRVLMPAEAGTRALQPPEAAAAPAAR